MTDYELVYFLNECFNTLFSVFSFYMTGLFAMLVASYLAAAKLKRRMAGLVVGLFSLFAFATIPATVAATARLASVLAEADRRAAVPDSGIAFVFTSAVPVPYMVPTIAALLVGSYIGAIVFFVQARRSARD